MEIIKAKYTEETLNWVSIEFEDGTKGQSSTTDGIRRQYTDTLDEYIADGGIVEEQYTTAEIAQTATALEVSEAKAYLTSTDYKVLPDYDGDTAGIVEARAEARNIIRTKEVL